MSDVEEDLMQIVAELGEDAERVLRMLVDVYRLGVRAGDKTGFERGYAEGARETKRKALEQLGSVAIDAPGYDEAGAVALTTPISELSGLDLRVRLTLAREYSFTDRSKQPGEEGRDFQGTLGDLVNATPDHLTCIRGFGPKAAVKLYDYLKSIGYERSELLEII